MLQLSATLLNKHVMSLRTGGAVATIDAAIINPNNLKIEGFYCLDTFSKDRLVLLSQDIRDIIGQGFVIDDHDVLAQPEDLIRLKEIMDIKFELMGKPVETENREKVGKVTDYAVDSQALYIQKLYVGQSLLKSLSTGQISVDRNQIVEITNRKIVIKELLKPVSARAPLGAPATS